MQREGIEVYSQKVNIISKSKYTFGTNGFREVTSFEKVRQLKRKL